MAEPHPNLFTGLAASERRRVADDQRLALCRARAAEQGGFPHPYKEHGVGVLQAGGIFVDAAYGKGPGCRWFQLDALRRRLGRIRPLDALAGPDYCPLLYGFGIPTRDLFDRIVDQVYIQRRSIPTRDRRWIDWQDWGTWLSGHCLLASRWMGHHTSDEPASL